MAEWKVSLHGGHSGDFCDHARGSLREILEKAVLAGYHTFGVSEHVPRVEERFLYAEEVKMGWGLEKLEENFKEYTASMEKLVGEFSGEIIVLKGFEAEVIPDRNYPELMAGYREAGNFDYMVGSVHYVGEILIDGPIPLFERAIEDEGGLEKLALRYYEGVARMVENLRPEVVGHLDLIRKLGHRYGPVDTPMIRKGAEEALSVIRDQGCILDLNTAGYRKGLKTPYPEPWLVKLAHEKGIGFCFGDDSHSPEDVGAGVEEAREYLLDLGVKSVTVLTRERGAVVNKVVGL